MPGFSKSSNWNEGAKMLYPKFYNIATSVQSILSLMLPTITVLVTLTLVKAVAAYEDVDPNNDLSIQLAQLKTLEHLAELQHNVSQNQHEVLKQLRPKNQASDWMIYLFALPLTSLFYYFITQVMRTVFHIIKMRNDSLAETLMMCSNVQNVWHNRTEFRTLQEYRDSLNPPILYTVCSCCKRQSVRNNEEYSLN